MRAQRNAHSFVRRVDRSFELEEIDQRLRRGYAHDAQMRFAMVMRDYTNRVCAVSDTIASVRRLLGARPTLLRDFETLVTN